MKIYYRVVVVPDFPSSWEEQNFLGSTFCAVFQKLLDSHFGNCGKLQMMVHNVLCIKPFLRVAFKYIDLIKANLQ